MARSALARMKEPEERLQSYRTFQFHLIFNLYFNLFGDRYSERAQRRAKEQKAKQDFKDM